MSQNPDSNPQRLYRTGRSGVRRMSVHTIFTVLAIVMAVGTAQAGNYNWNDIYGQWGESAKWSPNAVPGAADNAFIGNTVLAENGTVFMDQNVTLSGLTITDGMRLQNQQRKLQVNGTISLSGSNTVMGNPNLIYPTGLLIGPYTNGNDNVAFNADTVEITDGANITFLNGPVGTVDQSLSVDADSRIYLEGTLRLGGNAGTAYRNDGVLQAGTGGATIFQNGTGRIDLDGINGNGRVSVATAANDDSEAAHLTIYGDTLTDAFDGEMTIGDNNEVDMQLSQGWTIGAGGVVTFYGQVDKSAFLTGEHVTINGTIEGQGKYGVIGADATINPSANVHVNPNDSFRFTGETLVNDGNFSVEEGGTLILAGTSTLKGGTFSTQSTDPNDGRVWFSGTTVFDGDVTMNGYARELGNAHVVSDSTITADTFVMGIEQATRTWTLDADLVVDADRVGSTSVNYVSADIVINSTAQNPASLEINVPDNANPLLADWLHTGDLTINGPQGNFLGVSVKGSPVNLQGDVTVTGHTMFTAKADFYPGGQTSLIGDSSLRLAGGNLADTNRISGRDFVGGRLESTNGHALVGHGTISSDIAFSGNSELRADVQTLNITGTISDVGVIGTASETGTLNVTQPWNTSVANRVELLGGELKGGAITNDGLGGIHGHGLISSRVLNNTVIAAEGGTLLLNSTLNDYDGASGQGETGRLDAVAGDLHVMTPQSFAYDGGVLIAGDHELFVDGGGFTFQPASIIRFDGGTLRGTDEQIFRGTLIASSLQANLVADGDFQSGSSSTLNANLAAHQNTRVRTGASFAGEGHLVNRTLGVLTLDDEAIVGVDVDNLGTLTLGQTIAQASVLGDVFNAGRINFDLGGNTADVYDRLLVSDTVSLRGSVDVFLLGYDPIGGDVFDILDFTTFVDLGYVLNLPGLSPGLSWDVSGFETVGELRIVPEPGTLLLIVFGAGLGLRRRRI